MKGSLADQKVGVQLLLLAVLCFAGTIVAGLAMLPLALIDEGILTNSTDTHPVLLLISQALSAIGMMLLPALGAAWLYSHQPKQFLHIAPVKHNGLIWVLGLMGILLLAPTVTLTGYVNSLMDLPDWAGGLEAWMMKMEQTVADMMRQFFSIKHPAMLVGNLFVIAVLAGVTEEFLFRGTLLSTIRRGIRNPHVAIWVVAIIFSAIHFQFYGFLPRLLLGVYLGYLLVWTRNLWIPIVAHLLNNAVAVVGMWDERLQENGLFAEQLPAEDVGWVSVVAAVTLVLFMGCIWWLQRRAKVVIGPAD